MQKRSSKRENINKRASRIVSEATGVDIPRTVDGKNAYAVALGRRGGLKGGVARANKLTAKQRSEIARKAAQARWHSTSNDSNEEGI